MKIHTLQRQQTITRSRRDVFAFFEQPDNLQKITPDSVGFTILTPSPIEMKSGAVLDYAVRVFGLSVRWTTLISAYDPPHRFSDVALRSPYSFWHHTHTFEEDGPNTLMLDEVHYALPLGPIGNIAHTVWVRRQLDRIFDYRAEVIGRILEGHNKEDGGWHDP